MVVGCVGGRLVGESVSSKREVRSGMEVRIWWTLMPVVNPEQYRSHGCTFLFAPAVSLLRQRPRIPLPPVSSHLPDYARYSARDPICTSRGDNSDVSSVLARS